MATTPEKKVKDAVLAILKRYGAYHHYTVTSGYGRSGAPDLFVCFCGRFIAIECKAGKNAPTALQNLTLKMIEASGGVTLVINEQNLDVLDTIMQTIKATYETAH